MDYPVMLYLGGLHSHAIAHDEDEANALKERGYMTHAEAMKIESKSDDTLTASGSFGDVEDQLDEANEHIAMLEGAIEVKDKEISDLKGELDEANERYEEKERELVELQNQPIDDSDSQEIADLKSKLAIYEETKDVNGDGVVSYDEMTKDELKAVLEQRDVEFVERDSKDALIQKAKDSE